MSRVSAVCDLEIAMTERNDVSLNVYLADRFTKYDERDNNKIVFSPDTGTWSLTTSIHLPDNLDGSEFLMADGLERNPEHVEGSP